MDSRSTHDLNVKVSSRRQWKVRVNALECDAARCPASKSQESAIVCQFSVLAHREAKHRYGRLDAYRSGYTKWSCKGESRWLAQIWSSSSYSHRFYHENPFQWKPNKFRCLCQYGSSRYSWALFREIWKALVRLPVPDSTARLTIQDSDHGGFTRACPAGDPIYPRCPRNPQKRMVPVSGHSDTASADFLGLRRLLAAPSTFRDINSVRLAP